LDALDSDLTSGKLSNGEFKNYVDLIKLASQEVTANWGTALPESAKYKLGVLLQDLESRVIVRRDRSSAFDETPQPVLGVGNLISTVGARDVYPVTDLCTDMSAWQTSSVMRTRLDQEADTIKGYLLGPYKDEMKGALNQLYMAADSLPKTDQHRAEIKAQLKSICPEINNELKKAGILAKKGWF